MVESLTPTGQINSLKLARPLDEDRDIITASERSISPRSSTIGGSYWQREFDLLVDPSLALASIDSPCFCIKTFLSLEVVLDGKFILMYR